MTQATAEAPLANASREDALAFYAELLDGGTDLTAEELAERFGRTDRWARNIRAEVAKRRKESEAVPEPAPEPADVPADPEPVPADLADEAPAFDEPFPETPAETVPVPALETPAAPNQATWTAAAPENPAPFALHAAQDATTADLPTPGHAPAPAATEPHTAAPSWTVQDPAAELYSETPAPDAGTLTVPATDLVADPAVPAVPAERGPEPVTPAGTLDASADVAPEPAETPEESPAEHGPEHGKVPGRFVAWLAFVTGIGASVAANMLHAAEGGAHAAELIGAAFWPLALLLSIELLTRVTWPRGWLWGTGRFVGVGLVAVVAFVLSYRHMAGLLTSWGEDAVNAYLGPLAVDGLMLVAATALLAITRTRKNRP